MALGKLKVNDVVVVNNGELEWHTFSKSILGLVICIDGTDCPMIQFDSADDWSGDGYWTKENAVTKIGVL